MTNLAFEPSEEGPGRSAPPAPSLARTAPLQTLAYTCAVDLCGESPKALALAKDLLKDVRKSGLRSPFADALLRRLALSDWTRRDRPRPGRLESKDPKESAILAFFLEAWEVTYEDLATALQTSEDRVRRLVHKARMERIAASTRIPIPRPECRRPRDLLSDFRERFLPEPLAGDVARHLSDCRECSSLDAQLRAVLEAPRKPLIDAPPELTPTPATRPGLSLSLDGVSRAKRRVGLVLLGLGVVMSAFQLHPGLNASASAQMDRMGASLSKWRGRAERLQEDLKVLRALALGAIEGRTEELGQTLDEYLNSRKAAETGDPRNKPAPDAVLDSRDPKARPAERTQSPKNP